MPVVSFAHGYFWRAKANAPPPPVLTRGGYPAWQSSVIASLFGALQVYWERLAYAWRFFRLAWRWSVEAYGPKYLASLEQWADLDADRRMALACAIAVMTSPAWAQAQAAVMETAHAPQFNRQHAWVALSHTMKENSGGAENAWRHMKALHLLETGVPGLSGPVRNLLIELAYHEYAASNRGRPKPR